MLRLGLLRLKNYGFRKRKDYISLIDVVCVDVFRKEESRRVSSISITLSLDPLDTSAVGYQAPLPEEEVKPSKEEQEESN